MLTFLSTKLFNNKHSAAFKQFWNITYPLPNNSSHSSLEILMMNESEMFTCRCDLEVWETMRIVESAIDPGATCQPRVVSPALMRPGLRVGVTVAQQGFNTLEVGSKRRDGITSGWGWSQWWRGSSASDESERQVAAVAGGRRRVALGVRRAARGLGVGRVLASVAPTARPSRRALPLFAPAYRPPRPPRAFSAQRKNKHFFIPPVTVFDCLHKT